jgi:hypothetical protein
MSLSYRQEDQLRRVEAGVRRSDPHVAGMFGVFGRLYADDGMPAWEQVAQEPASRSRLRQATAWSVASLIAVAAAISVLLSKAFAVATARRGALARALAAERERTRLGREADAQQDADWHQKPWHPGRADGGLGRPDGPA